MAMWMLNRCIYIWFSVSCNIMHNVRSKTTYKSNSYFFLRITQYIGDTHNARILIHMNTGTQTLPPRSIFEDCRQILKIAEVTTNPTPRSIFEDCRQILKIAEVTTDASLSTGRRLPLKAQTPLNPDKFAPTGSRTQELRCYLSWCYVISNLRSCLVPKVSKVYLSRRIFVH
jgi:hypothetical protein